MEVSLESSVAVSVSPTEHETSEEYVTDHFNGSHTLGIGGICGAGPAAASSLSFAVKKVGVMPIAPMPP